MTLGIAPLLFVQVLYGQFFYTANILIGYVWLALLGLMILIFYLLYYGWYRIRHGRGVRLVGLVVLGLMSLVAVILAGNGTLLQNPAAWQGFRANMGLAPYMGDTTFAARWVFALSALIAGGGLFVAIFMRLAAKLYGETPGREVPKALVVSALGLIAMLAAGLWGSFSLPSHVSEGLSGNIESVFAYVAAGALAATVVLVFLVRKSTSVGALALPGLTFFVSLFSIAALRDTLRRLALAEHFKLSAVTVNSQWESFFLFAVIFVLGLALVAYMVYLAFGSKSKAEGA